MQNNHSVKVPFEFFKKVRRDYADWRTATVRELIQNCLDARSTEIHFTVSTNGNVTTLSCRDNGHGMTQDTLLNVFMVLGGSKKEEGSLGGFGMAKMVLFSADQYEITTSDTKVRGVGSEYEVLECKSVEVSGINKGLADLKLQPDSWKGVEVSLTYVGERDDLENDWFSWASILRRYLRTCSFESEHPTRCKVFLNGMHVPQLVRDFKFASPCRSLVFNALQGDVSTVIYQTQGLAMFSRSTFSSGNTNIKGVYELGRVNAPEYFTTNRDAFTAKMDSYFSNEVNNTILNYKTTVQGLATLTMTINPEDENVNGFDDTRYPDNFHVMVKDFRTSDASIDNSDSLDQRQIHAVLKSAGTAKFGRQWNMACKIVLASAVYVHETPQNVDSHIYDSLRTLVEDYDVAKMIKLLSSVKYYHQGLQVKTGFAYAAGVEALCSGNTLMINPQGITDDYLLLDMLDTAIHECAHLWQQHHGEGFTTKESQLRKCIRRTFTEKQIENLLAKA